MSWRLQLVFVTAVTICLAEGPANAQKPETVGVRFKVFDSNAPTKVLKPVNQAINFVRDPVTKKPQLLEAVAITGPDKDGFYQLKVSKGWLIEQLVIQIDDPEKDYNPAIITKVVSAADMTLYPGASRSTDAFGIQAYLAQLGAYKTLMAELLDIVPEASRPQVRDNLKKAFQSQLLSMAKLDERLPDVKAEDLVAARKLLNQVFEAYGLPYTEEPALPAPCHLGEPAPATIAVSLPADAKLFIDGVPTSSIGSLRNFVTPPLTAEKDFTYTLKVELFREGKSVVQEIQVTVRASHITRAHFDQ
jgi:uncharacterized protein (TIGR03000 family)